MTDQPPDRVVSRVNEITTTALDALGMVGIAVGIGWVVAVEAGVGYGLVFGALALLAFSTFAQHRAAGPRPKRPEPSADETVVLPGPSHPGNTHFAGGR